MQFLTTFTLVATLLGSQIATVSASPVQAVEARFAFPSSGPCGSAACTNTLQCCTANNSEWFVSIPNTFSVNKQDMN